MKAHDKDKFEQEMESEIQRLIDKSTFDIVHLSKVPKGKTILNSVWTFKRKTHPSGEIYRYRSRLCVDGSRQQHGVDFSNSYSPVVNWSTIRLLFII